MELDDDLDISAIEQMIAISDSFEEAAVKTEVKTEIKEEIITQNVTVSVKEEVKDEPEPMSQCSQRYTQSVKSQPDSNHLDILNRCFGHTEFRPIQWDIISTVLERRDVCAIMTTGYGKSLCYQYPSTFAGGITLVISPLISLMEDQILSLNVNNIPACLLGTAQTQKAKVMEDIFNNAYNLVYLTPEFCVGDSGKHMLRKMAAELSVTLIAIDEAHCISSWGHDFRPQFRGLGVLRELLPGVPMIAVTATATPRVRLDISLSLRMKDPLMVCSGFDRPNLYIEVNYQTSRGVMMDLRKALIFQNNKWKFSGPTIIYVIRRVDAEEMADTLTANGINALPYHAGMALSKRKENHEKFVRDKVDVICATIAFGMGIDKPDVRNIIHYGCSGSVESYYQEIGRAGRDGLPANCVTFWSQSNIATYRALVQLKHKNSQAIERKEAQLQMMMNYLNARECRRKFILSYFGENVDHLTEPRRTCCDVCTSRRLDSRKDADKYEGINDRGEYDFTSDAGIFLNAVSAMNENFGLIAYISFLRGSKKSVISKFVKHPLHGTGKHKAEDWWKIVAELLKQKKYVQDVNRTNGQGFSYVILSLDNKGRIFLQQLRGPNPVQLWMKPPVNALKFLKAKPHTGSGWLAAVSVNHNKPSTSKQIVEAPKEAEARMNLYRKLLEQRVKIAAELDCMPYIIASNTALMQMARSKPRSTAEMRSLNLDGINEAKITKFGERFLRIIDPLCIPLDSLSSKVPIKDILQQKPLPNVKPSMTAEATFSCYKSGLTVGEIAAKRRVTESTINNHLLTCLKIGYEVKIGDLGVTQETREIVTKAVKDVYGEDVFNVKLTMLREACTNIPSHEISFVLAYLQVRHHLKVIGRPYEEFEDFEYDKSAPPTQISQSSSTDEDFENRITALLDYCDEVMKKEESDAKDVKEEPVDEYLDLTPDLNDVPQAENVVVKEEIEIETGNVDEFSAILDLPQEVRVGCEVQNEIVQTGVLENVENFSNHGKRRRKGNLPPWLVKKSKK